MPSLQNPRSLPLVAAGLALVLAAAGCGDALSDNPSGSDGSVIRIGFIAERSGVYQAYGNTIFRSSQVAVDEFNKAGGVSVGGKKYTFELDVCDDNSDQTQVAACATKLVKDNGDRFVFGGLGQFGPIVAGITDPNGAIYFASASAVANKLDHYRNVLLVVPALPLRMQLAVKGLMQAYPTAKRVAMLGDEEATTTQTFPPIAELMKAAGLEVVSTQVVPSGQSDPSGQLTEIKRAAPDVLYVYNSSPERMQTTLTAAERLHVATQVFQWTFGCDAPATYLKELTYTGDTFAGASTTDAAPNVAAFMQTYYAQPGVTNPDPNISAALWNYDFFGMLGEAMADAGSTTDTARIVESFGKISYDGLNGTITMKDRAAVFQQSMCTLKDGEITNFLVQPN
ncbi:ABC transporter substrate-binding protein [Rhizomonospora bruguierae]|uniref:ABC transporter substrate-binding protein n=1 Tax=Rhizomonospora bruguierae TaxID=1581705 RepID=UPI001BCD3BA6|nr:ABC transporter substrate-binding protein [Micromonospora sp. NBRC 107566]